MNACRRISAFFLAFVILLLCAACSGTAKQNARYLTFLESLLSGEHPDGVFDPLPVYAFALYDVDGDGREELLLRQTGDISAEQSEQIFRTDGNDLSLQLIASPELVIYDNGTVLSPWSHNQGMGWSEWPFTVYTYDKGEDRYDVAGSMDSWDGNIFPVHFDATPFPEELDTDGDGVLYYLSDGEIPDYSTLLDGAEYRAWLDGFLGDASVLDIPYLPLSRDNLTLVFGE